MERDNESGVINWLPDKNEIRGLIISRLKNEICVFQLTLINLLRNFL